MTLITIVGSGRVGVSAAVHIVLRELGDVRLIDVVEGLPQGEALDLAHMASLLGLSVDVSGSNDYKDMAGSDVVIIAAGATRKPGMTREDLLKVNAGVVKSICNAIKDYAPRSIVIVVTNPLDVMTYLAWRALGFPRGRVLGFSGLLDVARFKYYVSKRIGVSPRSVEAYVIGQHGEKMIPLVRHTKVGGVPIERLLRLEEVEEVVSKTVRAGEEIIRMKGWSASHAPGAGISVMVESIVKDRRDVLPLTAVLDGEYGFRDVAAEVMGIVGREGLVRVLEIELSNSEYQRFREAVEWIKHHIDLIKAMI